MGVCVAEHIEGAFAAYLLTPDANTAEPWELRQLAKLPIPRDADPGTYKAFRAVLRATSLRRAAHPPCVPPRAAGPHTRPPKPPKIRPPHSAS